MMSIVSFLFLFNIPPWLNYCQTSSLKNVFGVWISSAKAGFWQRGWWDDIMEVAVIYYLSAEALNMLYRH